MVAPEQIADKLPTSMGINLAFEKLNIEKKAPKIWYRGAPGGCPTCSLELVSMYSPLSQNESVGS